MDRNSDIVELSVADLEHVSGGSLLSAVTGPIKRHYDRQRVKNAIKIVERAGDQIRDALESAGGK
jgi:hypothetical protein